MSLPENMESKQTFNPLEFRRALGTFTTGVTIVTARAPDGTPVGVTANSFNSLSLDPPLVLWSLAKTARSMPAFDGSDHFAIHILSAAQDDLSNRFATSGQDKFAGVTTIAGIGELPLLEGCTARLQCRATIKHDGGDHIIFIGEVLDFTHSDAPPLVFHAGRYALAARKSSVALLPKHSEALLNVGFDEDFLGYLLPRAHFQFFRGMRAVMRDSGLTEVDLYVLIALTIRKRCSRDEVTSMIRIGFGELSVDPLRVLRDRGLVVLDGQGESAGCAVTAEGRQLAIEVIAASKAVESGVLDRFGYANAIAFKNLLKAFIASTNESGPQPWDAVDPNAETP